MSYYIRCNEQLHGVQKIDRDKVKKIILIEFSEIWNDFPSVLDWQSTGATPICTELAFFFQLVTSTQHWTEAGAHF